MASLAASEPAMISVSQEESATEVCFFEAQLMVAEPMWKVWPEVECFTPQSESLKPSRDADRAVCARVAAPLCSLAIALEAGESGVRERGPRANRGEWRVRVS
jgi:hypothetical protein